MFIHLHAQLVFGFLRAHAQSAHRFIAGATVFKFIQRVVEHVAAQRRILQNHC